MPREQEYRAKDKRTHKMTRDGLVERNESTGDIERVSQRGQDFELRAQEDTQRTVAPDSIPKGRMWQKAVERAGTTDIRQEPARPPLRDAPGDRGDQVSAPQKQAPVGKLKFTKDETPPERAGSNSLGKKLAQRERVAQQAKAKKDAPAQHSAPVRTAIDSEAARPTRLRFENTTTSGPGKVAKGAKGKKGANLVTQAAHAKVQQAEDDNVGTEAAHTAEQAAENVGRSALQFGKSRKAARAEQVHYARQVQAIRRTGPVQQAAKNAGTATGVPKFSSNPVSRFMQKWQQKRQYAKAAREARRAGTTLKSAGSVAGKLVSNMAATVSRHPAVFIFLGGGLLLFIIVSAMFSSCSGMFSGGGGVLAGASYVAPDADIDKAELAYTEWETDLQVQVANIERDRPGYDEYRKNVADIGHNPFELMAWLTAAHEDFTFAGVEPVLRQIFNEQYQLSIWEEVETRYNDPDDENEDGDLEEYEWRILHVDLTARSFTDLVAARMDTAQAQHYAVLMESHGMRQHVASPFDFNWLPYVSSYYGYRIHPNSGEKDYHKAVDIAVPAGTEIRAAHDGVVGTAANHSSYGLYIVLDGEDGVTTKYAHCQTLLVSAGQEVKRGDVIARVGNTGEVAGAGGGYHLHFEVLKDGEYLNPLYFADIPANAASFAGGGTPGAPMGDGSLAALLAEAEKHIGKRYVFGASGPDYFDCSGFVCWCLNQSGVASVGRTTAQGLYNMSAPVSAAEAQPGDLIFFHSTYSTTNTVTHVGIYLGNGQMIHCGDPIGYASINTSYWQQHFYAFGRI